MKRITFHSFPLVVLSFLAANTQAQTISQPARSAVPDTIQVNDVVFTRVEVEASFPGGEDGWRNFLLHNLKASVPVDKGAKAGSYTVLVQFIVGTDGKVSDLKALTNYGYGMEKEVLRLMKTSPKWEPAVQNGRKVKAYRKQPITFVITEG